MFGIILLVAMLTGGVNSGALIRTSPKDFTGTIGGNAIFWCHVDFGGIQTIMSWEFNNAPVYNYQFGMVDYPKGKEKYSVAKDGNNFTLTVKDLDLKDGGEYKCLVAEIWDSAVLLVLDIPELFVSAPNSVKVDTAEFICLAKFGGPNKEAISSEHYPNLQMYLDGVLVNGTNREQLPNGSTYWYNLIQIYNMTLEASIDGRNLICIIETSQPAMQKNTTREVNALLPKDQDWPESGVDSWIIAVSITIPVLLVIAGLAALYFCRRKQKGTGRQHYHLVSLGEPKSHEEKKISTLGVAETHNQNEKTTYRELTEIIASLDHWKDLDDNTVKKIEGLLNELNDELPSEKPSPLSQLIKKMKILIPSDHTGRVAKAFVSKFATLSKEREEDPLLCLVELLEKDHTSLTEHPEKLLELITELLKVDGPTDTRSKCFRMLLLSTMKQKKSQEDRITKEDEPSAVKHIQWNSGFIAVLKCLVKKGADPAWSPEGSTQGSNLHLFLVSVKRGISHKSHLSANFMELLEVMMTDSSVSRNNVDCEGRTILHAVVDEKTRLLVPDIADQLLKIISRVQTRNPILLDATDNMKRTPLHTFVANTIPAAAKQCTDGEDSRLQILKCLISPTNKDLKCRDQKTPLHYFTEWAKSKEIHPNMFLEVVRCLKSTSNINFQDKNGDTALMTVILAAREYADYPNVFFNVVQCLKTDSNINLQHESKGVPLSAFIRSAAKEWSKNPESFLAIVNLLRSDTNIDLYDEKKRTPLLEFTRAARQWANCPDILLKVVKNLISDSNINLQDEEKRTPLSAFIRSAKERAMTPESFLEIINLLRSNTNINLYDEKKRTPLLEFTLAAKQWPNSPDIFLKVVQSLTSDSNINLQDEEKRTPLSAFILETKEWLKNPKILDVVKCLRSDYNVDFQLKDTLTPLFAFTLATKEWSENPEIFLEIVGCLKSGFNINLKYQDKQTPLSAFVSAAKEWAKHPNIFLGVVNSLKSFTNINVQLESGMTPLHQVMEAAGEWADASGAFFEVIKCLTSNSNVNLQTTDGHTALDLYTKFAKNWRKKQFSEVCRYLNSKAKSTAKDSKSPIGQKLGGLVV